MGMINIKFNKMVTHGVRRRGEVKKWGFFFICNILVLKNFWNKRDKLLRWTDLVVGPKRFSIL